LLFFYCFWVLNERFYSHYHHLRHQFTYKASLMEKIFQLFVKNWKRYLFNLTEMTESINIVKLRGGRNVENQNVKGPERQKYFLNWSERWKWRGWSESRKSECRKSKKECWKSKMTFDVLIFFDAIGNIRTSKV